MNEQISMLETVARVLSQVPLPSSSQEGQRYSCIWTKWQLLTFDLPMMLIALWKSRPELNITTSRTCCEPLGFKKLQNQGHPYVAGNMRKFQLM